MIVYPWLFASSTSDPIELTNPTNPNLETLSYCSSSPADVDAAIGVAASAAELLRGTTALSRSKILIDIAKSLRIQAEQLANSMTSELGKPHADGLGEVENAAAVFEYFSALLLTRVSSFARSINSADDLMTLRSPLGVIAAIAPWNFPINIASVKIAPALAFGNAVVLKPSPQATRTTQIFVDAMYKAGLPAGAVSVVQGAGAEVPERLIRDSRISAVTFTGSTSVGRQIMVLAAERNIRAQCEMGGKNAAVVLADADLPRAVNLIVDGAFRLAGQRCTATSRVIVEQSIYDEFRRLLIEATKNVVVGDPTTAGILVGPLVNADRIGSVEQAVLNAIADGGRVLTGGNRYSAEALPGYFYPPTVIEIGLDSPAAQSEIFGPVITLHSVEGIDEAIAAVNNSDYGLTAAICTSNIESSLRFVNEVEAGAVSVNGSTAGWQYQQAFGGWKNSGAGIPEQGPEAELFFTRQKTARFHHTIAR
jgi:acyl-CoA reductase-like NAD-dependent aldehyde dehydrogenase